LHRHGGGFEGSIQGGFLAAVQMNKDKIWLECDDEKFVDDRVVKLTERKTINDNTLELSFAKPAGFEHLKDEHAILEIMNPKELTLDLPYRWLPLDSNGEDKNLRFQIKTDDSSFSKSCQLIDIGDEAIVYGPLG
jgi:hypothetical protein